MSFSYKCALHPDTPITHFCESCLDLVCEKCITKQPHSSSAHSVKQIFEAANTRKNLYADFVDKQVNKVRSKAQKKMNILNMNKKQYQRDKKVLQKDIKIQFQAILNRQQDNQSQNVISLQTQIKHLQNIVHNYDDIVNAFDSVYENPQGLLISYRSFDNQIKKMQALKQSLSQINHSQKQTTKCTTQMGREFQTTLLKSGSLVQYQERNQIINKLIGKYIQHYRKQIKLAENNISQQGKVSCHLYNNAFQSVLSDQNAKICLFCGFPFTIQYVNQPCSNNRTFKINCIYSTINGKNCQQILPQQIRGSKRHYWVKSESTHRKKPTIKQHVLVRKNIKKNFWNSLSQLQIIKHILKNYEIETGKKFKDVIQANDPEKSGFISKIAFIYTLSKIYMLTKQQVDSLIQACQEEKGININKFELMLSQPFTEYYGFLHQQMDDEKNKSIAPKSVGFPSNSTSSWRRY